MKTKQIFTIKIRTYETISLYIPANSKEEAINIVDNSDLDNLMKNRKDYHVDESGFLILENEGNEEENDY